MTKLVIIDYSVFMYRAIFAWRKQKQIPVEYTCLNMILSCLRKIGIEPMDEVIIACDGKNNWRKQFSTEYKANRKAFRESFEDINWEDMYYKFDILLENLDIGTSFHIVKIDMCEADDIGSVCCRYFPDKEIILVTIDSDWEQLGIYPNVKIFSPIVKYKGTNGAYKIKKSNFNVYNFLAKKINKEVADNLISPILSEDDFNIRKMLVSLIELPDFVESQVVEVLSRLIIKNGDINYVPFKTLRDKLDNLYNDKSKIITYENCKEYQEAKELRKKKKKNKRRIKS